MQIKTPFSTFCSLEIIICPFASLISKFQVCNVLASKLEHFGNDIHSAETLSMPLPEDQDFSRKARGVKSVTVNSAFNPSGVGT